MKEKISAIGWKLFLLVIGVVLVLFGFYIMVLGELQVGLLLMIFGAGFLIIFQRVLLYKRFKFGLEFGWEYRALIIVLAIFFIMMAIAWVMGLLEVKMNPVY